MRMVRQDVHVLTQHLMGLKPNHARPGWVDENAGPLQIDPEDPLARGCQHEAQRVTPSVDHVRNGGLELV